MKLVRFQAGGQTRHGIAEGENIREIEGDLLGDHALTGSSFPLNTVKLLTPCVPSKILALGLNYALHVQESGSDRQAPSQPEPFYKVPSSLCDPGDPICIPPGAGMTHFEGELVAVIGKTCKRVAPENALEYVLIPQQADTIKYISAKLQELERGNISRLMKIKDLVAM